MNSNAIQRPVPHSLLWAICFVFFCITLTLGLWPFHSPRNEVTWLPDANGIAYDRAGTVLSQGEFPMPIPANGAGLSIEVWAQRHPRQKHATLLTFYRPGSQLPLKVGQSDTNLLVQPGVPGANFNALDVFTQAVPAFITIASGGTGTAVYADGKLAGRNNVTIPRVSMAGQLILGDAPFQPESWRGRILGLAIYDTELTLAQTERHRQTWKANGSPDVAMDEKNTALYLFDEHQGHIVRNHARQYQGNAALDLQIPQRYEVIDKKFMEPFWEEFELSRSYLSAAIKNIVGLVPLGFIVYATLTTLRSKRAALLAVASGTLASLTIELVQWFLPTRESGTTDLFTNTLGAWVGVLLCRYTIPTLRLPWLRLPS